MSIRFRVVEYVDDRSDRDEGVVRIWSEKGLVNEIRVGAISSLSLSGDGRFLAVGRWYEERRPYVEVYDTANGNTVFSDYREQERAEEDGFFGCSAEVAFSPGHQTELIVSWVYHMFEAGFWCHAIEVWQPEKRRLSAKKDRSFLFPGNSSSYGAMVPEWSVDGSHIVLINCSSFPRALVVLNSQTLECSWRYELEDLEVLVSDSDHGLGGFGRYSPLISAGGTSVFLMPKHAGPPFIIQRDRILKLSDALSKVGDSNPITETPYSNFTADGKFLVSIAEGRLYLTDTVTFQIQDHLDLPSLVEGHGFSQFRLSPDSRFAIFDIHGNLGLAEVVVLELATGAVVLRQGFEQIGRALVEMQLL